MTDRARREDFVGAGHRADAGAYMDSGTAPLLAATLALAGVHARANPDTSGGERGNQIQRAAGRLGRSVEEGEDAVARVFGSVAAVLSQQPVDDFVVGIELVSPVRIAGRAELLSGADNVGE